jgi:peptidoglycan/LPS O-acetylase OafA/YrhL
VRTKDKAFRSDIAALRALAVTLVLLSHFGIPGFGFGFVGVDIFFVISGFLITRILYKEYLSSADGDPKKSSISLSVFYLRRMRRLLPAAFTVIIVVNIISFFLSNPLTRSSLLSNSKWAALFLANVSFLRSESDYFQQNNEPSMLQHYWSLSVEEQFYFIWPLLFVLSAHFQLLKIKGRSIRFNVRILFLIALLSFISFLLMIYNFSQSPVETYFAIFTRAWELGIGSFFGILAFHKKPQAIYSRLEQYLPIIFGLLLVSVIIDSSNWAYLVPIPVIATGFLLYAGQDQAKLVTEAGLVPRFAGKFVMYIGAISYSLYLVHWPIFIIAKHLKIIDSLATKFILFPISICAAHLLWKYIETPFQKIKLPKANAWEEKMFHYIKSKRVVVASLFIVIVGGLYVVTYPEVSSKYFPTDSALRVINSDPNLEAYSNYQSQIVSSMESQGTLEPLMGDSSTPISNGASLSQLAAENDAKLQTALKNFQIPIDIRSQFTSLLEDQSPFEKSQCGKSDTEVPPNCNSGSPSSSAKQVALIGDSKMGAMAQPIIDYFVKKGWRVVPMAMFGCEPSVSSSFNMKNCAARSSWISKEIASDKYTVAFFAEYPTQTPKTPALRKYQNDFFKNLESHTEKLFILSQIPKVANPRDCVQANFTFPSSCTAINVDEIPSFGSTLSYYKNISSIKTLVVDSYKWFTINQSSPVIVDNIFVSRDGVHLTYSFVRSILPLINATLDSLYIW